MYDKHVIAMARSCVSQLLLHPLRYFVATIGYANEETIKKYIAPQQEESYTNHK